MYDHNELKFNYELLEFLGDTIFKLLATIEIICENPRANEGEMHLLRSSIVKNNNLKRVGVKKKIFFFMFTTKFIPWIPCGFVDKTKKK